MNDTDFILALFHPVHIREDPDNEVRQYSEELRQQQKELLADLIAEQNEQR